MRFLVVCILIAFASGCGHQKNAETPAPSKYAGQEDRAIKTLSDEDVKELLDGGGWGFAKAAELNGVPGPRHVLDMRDHLGLTQEQTARTEEVMQGMKARAVELGSRFVEVEKDINDRFARGDMDPATLRRQLDESADVRSELAFVHLEAHLRMLDILSPEQISAYNEMRGYGEGDPCRAVPEGHDPELWRKHNNCEG